MPAILAQTTWTGASNSNWNNAANWSAGVPTTSQHVVIPNVAPAPVIQGGTAAVANSVYVQGGALLTIQATGSLTINDSFELAGVSSGFRNLGTVSNSGLLVIGSTSAVGDHGLFNLGVFNNNSGAEIRIDRSANSGIYSNGTFTNAAKITIGAIADVGSYGIMNQDIFHNNTGGEIKIDRTSDIGLRNFTGTCTNAAKITIGATADVGDHGIENFGIFQNNSGGEIKIDRTSGSGLSNFSIGTYTNAAKITIGATANVGYYGLENAGTFHNNSGGEIKIDRSDYIGLLNKHRSAFTNAAKITIGATADVGSIGIVNEYTFHNNSGGEIKIDRTSEGGLKNIAGTFTNSAKITIGATADVGIFGLSNNADFNNAGGEITINRYIHSGLSNEIHGTFTNAAKIIVETGIGANIYGLDNIAPFQNSACGEIYLYARVFNIGTYTNNGLMLVNTDGWHSNGTLINHGIIAYPMGNPINNVTNNEIIIAPTTANDCHNISPAFSLGSPVNFTIHGVFTDANATMPAGTYTVATNTFTPSPALPEGSYDYYVKIQDGAGNCTRIVPWQLTTQNCCEAPEAFCKPAVVSLNALGQAGIAAADINNGSTADCGLQSMVADPALVTCADLGTVTVTLTVTDSNDQTATCSATVTVQDNVAPTAVCQNATVSLDASGSATLAVSAINNGSADACGIASLSLSKTTFDCSNTGANSVTLTATDNSNQTATCSATVTVQDNVAPTAVCQNATVSLDASGNVTLTVSAINNGSADACGIASFSLSKTTFDCSNIGANTVMLAVIDNNGQTATCSATVTVQDNLFPTLTCPNAVTVTCSANVPAVNLAGVSATDNCGTPVKSHLGDATTNQTCVNRKTVTRTYRATDGSGNSNTCSQVITVFDNVQPNFTSIPANVTVQCSSVPAVGSSAATDGCSGSVSITYNGQTTAAGACADAYTITRQWTATDACGNTKTATQRITVVDTQKPNFTSTPANLTVQCDAVPTPATPTATDNCDASVAVTYNGQTQTNGACPNAYALTRIWTAADNCGNTKTVTQRITVVDNGKPVFTSFPENTTIACNDNPPPAGSPTATDACGSASVTYLGQSTANGSCPGNYQIKRTWRATDACGNSTVATQTIQVTDSTLPVFISVPADMTVQCNQLLPSLQNPTASDACGGYVAITFLGQSATGSGCAENYTVTRTWEAEDLCGNTTTVSQVIMVLGNNNVEGGAENREEGATGLITHRSSLIALFPNPTTDRVWLDLTDFAGEEVTVSIFSDLGQLLWERQISVTDDTKLSLSLREAGAKAGMYTVSVRSADNVAAKRVILME